jgi:hypothetical protein
MLAFTAAGCSGTTARLTPELTRRFESEGTVHRADDVILRFTHGIGTRRGGWEDVKASVIVTRRSIVIHRNAELLLDLHGGQGGEFSVRRDHDRLSLRIGGRQSAKSWSFRPRDDAQQWAEDMRAALRAPADTSAG